MLKIKAVQKESTLKPPTILAHNRIIIALIANKNKPNVIIVKGKVNKTKIGFINILSNPRTIATYKAVMNPAIWTPFIKWAMSKTKADVIRILKSNFIVFNSKVK